MAGRHRPKRHQAGTLQGVECCERIILKRQSDSVSFSTHFSNAAQVFLKDSSSLLLILLISENPIAYFVSATVIQCRERYR